MLPLYENQSVDLNCKSIDWFLNDGNIGTLVFNSLTLSRMESHNHILY